MVWPRAATVIIMRYTTPYQWKYVSLLKKIQRVDKLVMIVDQAMLVCKQKLNGILHSQFLPTKESVILNDSLLTNIFLFGNKNETQTSYLFINLTK